MKPCNPEKENISIVKTNSWTALP
jgi:hypothetical protein